MRKLDAAQNEHDDIASLLPWYLNRTLGADESSRVEAHIEGCSECQQDSRLVNVALDVAANHDVAFDSSDARLSRVLDRIDRYESGHARSGSIGRWLQTLSGTARELFASPTRRLGLAFAVAIAVLAGVLGTQLLATRDADLYEVRSSPAESALSLRVRFNTAMSAKAVETLLHDAGVDFTWRPDGDDQILIVIPESLPANDLFDLMQALKSQTGVRAVETTTP